MEKENNIEYIPYTRALRVSDWTMLDGATPSEPSLAYYEVGGV